MEENVNKCAYGALDNSNYSSPMPLIGLYITAATLVCLFFILVDVSVGFRNRKRWLPCRFFSLNSVTLTLLSIAVKLPVDLTSPMPGVQDQLSKLTEFILNHQVHGSVEDLYECLERLFVDISIEYLIQLPNTIFKEIVECHLEEFEKRIKSVLKILGKIKQLEGVVPWSFPEGTNISHLISDEGTAMKSFMTAAGSMHNIGRDCGNQSDSKTARDEIIQVE
ncbi:hypothetical protein Sjap_008328 [Stephania japonica]|uniref:Uncharacterized protein n=1 Tax=Stephania japonica TaxID=461633 RepID=A0AAP0JPY8_9MAGN